MRVCRVCIVRAHMHAYVRVNLKIERECIRKKVVRILNFSSAGGKPFGEQDSLRAHGFKDINISINHYSSGRSSPTSIPQVV